MTGMTDFTPSELSQIYFSLEIYKCNCVSLKSSSKEKKKNIYNIFFYTHFWVYIHSIYRM